MAGVLIRSGSSPYTSKAVLRLEPVAAKALEIGGELRLQVRPTEPENLGGKLDYSLGPGAPAGTSIDSQTGSFSWKPSVPGSCDITVFAVSRAGDAQRSETTFSVQVKNPAPVAVDRPPVLMTPDRQEVNEGVRVAVSVLVKDSGSSGRLIYSLRPDHPDGVVIDPATGSLAWTPKKAGSYRIGVVVIDAKNLRDATTLDVEVKHVCQPPVLEPLAPQEMASGEVKTLAASASDPDTPADRLHFSLVGRALVD